MYHRTNGNVVVVLYGSSNINDQLAINRYNGTNWSGWELYAKKSDLGTPGGKVIVKTEVNDLDVSQDSFISLSYTNAGGIPGGLNSNRAMVLNMDVASNFKAQLAFSFGADKIAIRRKANSTEWTEWKYFVAE